MNEKYLQDLYGWIKGQDPSYEGRYSYDQFKQKMQDETYATQMHGWISDKDETFSQRRPLTSFVQQVKAVSPMATQAAVEEPKKKEDTVSQSSVGGSEPTKSDGLEALAVKVQDESILTKKPRQERPMVSGESTKVVSPRVPQIEQQPDEIDKRLAQIQEENKGGKSYLEGIALNLGLGASYANEAFASIPESVINLLAIPQNYIAEKTGLPIGVTAEGIKESWGITNPLLDYVKEDQKILNGEVSKLIADRYDDPTISGNFQNGNYKEGFELLGSAITQSVPVSIGLMIGGAYTAPTKLATIATLGFTENQREELAAMDPTMSEAEKTLKAAGMAAAESVFSSIGTATIGKVYRDIAKREGAEAAKGIFRDGLVQTYKKALEKTGAVAGFVGEGIEEAATQITQNVISGKPVFEGVADAFVTGAGSGVVFTAPISAVNAKRYVDNKVQSYQTKSKVTEILKDKSTDISQVYNVPISSEISTSQLEISNLPNSRNLLVNNLKKSVSNGEITDADAKQSLFVFDKIQQVSNSVKDLDVSTEDKARVATLLRQRDDLRTKIQNKDDVLVVQEKRQIEDINNQIQEIITKPKEDAIQEQAAGQVPVQPGTGVSQEMAQGEPQAEPQGITQEGKAQEVVDPLKDVQSTTNALANALIDTPGIINDRDSFNAIYDIVREGDLFSDVREKASKEGGGIPQRAIAEKYHESKSNGTNPDFVQLVENAFIRQTPAKQEAIPASIQPEIDTIEAQRRQELEANKAGLDKPYYLGETEGPTLGEVINQKYDTQIEELKAKASPQQAQEVVTPQQVENQRKDLDMEVKALEDLLSDPNEEPLFKKSDNDTKFGEPADVVEDVVRQINELPSGNVTTTITPKPQNPINIDDLESRADAPVKRTTFDVIKGIPAVFSISDQLRIGNVTNPNTGNVIDKLFGGLGFGFTKGHEGFAWANTTKDEAQNLVNRAVSVYNNNKALFDDWWAKNPEYNGLVPLNIAKMAEGSIMSNEALYRVIKDNFASFPKKNKVDALNYLTKNRIPSIIDSLNKSLSNPNLKDNARKSVEKRIKALTGIQQKIKADNLKSVDQLLDPSFYTNLSLPVRAELISQLTIGSPNKPGEQKASGLPGKNTVPRALLGINQDASVSAKAIGEANLNKVSLSNAVETITEPAMRDVEPRQIIAIYGIDVLNPSVKETVHPNYKFGVNGRPIGVLENSVSIQEAYPFAYTNVLESLIAQEEKTGAELKAAPIESLINEKIPVGIGLPNLEFIGAISQGIMSNAQKLSAWINKSFPSVIMSTDAETFANVLKSEGVRVQLKGDEVVYGVTVDGDIYINPDVHNSDSALFNTTIHEFGHVWLNFLETTAEGKRLLNRGVDLVKKTGEYQDQLKKFNGNQTKAANEALAILIGNRGETIVNASLKSKFQEWLLGMWKYVKDKFKLSGDLTPQEIQDLTLDQFLGTAIADLFSGKALPVGEVQLKKLKNPEAAFSKSDSIDSIIQRGRANGFSEESIKIVLQKRGFTQEAIDAALGKAEPAAKKVEVTEEFAPGYDRMITELEGVVEKSLKRGTTQARAMENAINYLQGTKVYENATDVQREQMVRDVNKRFKKRQKSAPTAKRVLGQKKDVVTVTVDLAKERDRIIKEQIKIAKEVTGDLNEKRAALAENIKPLIKGGIITATQARTIINRISKVNLNNPIMVDKLIEYIDKVFDNANYAAEMDEIRKLQAQAKSRNHTSMTSLVNEFTSINPEDIPLVDKETGEPLNKIMEYKEALDFLNTRTPFYGKMNEVFDEMLSYKKAEKFDAVKTKDALIDKYKSIMDKYVGKDKNGKDKLKTVEDYVALIKDLNAFKRKAFQLLQNEAINQKEYEDLINGAGETQAVIDKKFAEPIAKIKNGIIADIKKQRPKTNPNFTNEENGLIKEYLQLNDSDIESLSPEDLFILNDLLDNISNGEIDYYRLSDIVSRAAGKQEGVGVSKQLKGSKVSLGSAKLREEMAKFESAFWEGLLGLGKATSGPLQKFIISPFNRAIGSYEKFTRDGYNDFLKLKKKYKIDSFDPLNKSKDMHKIGMLTTYLQEYMAQFDPKNKGVKDIGKRDWFKEILASETMRDDYSPKELKIIEEIYKSLPKDKDGNVDPKAVHDSYVANDGKFFTKNEKNFFDAIMQWKKENSTGKQKAANEMSGNPFKEIPFHVLRSRYGSMSSQITPTTSGDNGMVRINAGTGKERVSEAVGAINTDFEKLFIKGLEQTGRDFFLTKALKDINNVLASAKKELDGDKSQLIKAISYTLSDALSYEFSDTASQNILKRLVQARAAMTLFDPIRAGVEFTSTLLSFGLRARTLSGYKNLFGSQGDMKNLLEFTDSPLRLRQNISNAIDINDGKIEKQGMLTKWTTFLSGLPERTMMVTSWMPTFTNEFQRITKEKFDMKKFNDSEAYREKYGKAIKEASAVADAQTEKIIGPTTKAGQRREIIIFPGKTVGRDTVSGQILGFFSNYPYREVTEFVNGFKEAGEVLKKGNSAESILQLQKPLGIALNVAAYGFLSSVVYASRLILLGDDDEEERGSKMLEELMTAKGFIEETAANAAALAASKYAGGGRATLQLLATLAMDLTDNEETKATIKKMLKGSVYVDPLPTQNLTGYGSVDKVNTAILKYIPQLVMLNNVIIDGLGGLKELGAIYDKVESKGVDALTKDEELRVLALSAMFTFTQLALNYKGTSLPSYNNLKAGMKAVKEEAGVSDIASGKVPAKKKSSSGGGGGRAKTINKADLKKYFPELSKQIESATGEVEQEIKAFEKEQREYKKRIKDQVYGGN